MRRLEAFVNLLLLASAVALLMAVLVAAPHSFVRGHN